MADQTPNQFSCGQQLVVWLLRNRLQAENSPLPEISVQVWQQAFAFATKQRVALLLYDYLKPQSTAVPESLWQQMKRHYFANAVRNAKLQAELSALHCLFQEQGLTFIPLKGIVLADMLYHDIALRPCVDLDILVRPADLRLANRILAERGYQRLDRSHSARTVALRLTNHHWSYQREDPFIFLELHYRLLQKNRSADTSPREFWQRSQTLCLGGTVYPIFCPEDTLLYLAMHSAQDYWRSLLQLFDLATLIAGSPPLDWSLLLQRSQACGCRRRLLISCALAAEYFAVRIPASVEQRIASEDFARIVSHARCQGGERGDSAKGFWPLHLWFDLAVADRLADRMSVFAYKSFLQMAKMCTYRGRLRREVLEERG